ncbi:BTAD domain-containing putative transcriptional regulator [Streptomyces sp. NPDC056347]|uniref:BTAD domain-containing putative transcriptional regulator n=1 Tax=Streptomyces sp. NPDC056347 TaxID=3345790 RepID=UPI0035D7D55E
MGPLPRASGNTGRISGRHVPYRPARTRAAGRFFSRGTVPDCGPEGRRSPPATRVRARSLIPLPCCRAFGRWHRAPRHPSRSVRGIPHPVKIPLLFLGLFPDGRFDAGSTVCAYRSDQYSGIVEVHEQGRSVTDRFSAGKGISQEVSEIISGPAGSWIRSLRVRASLSQRELAARAGMSTRALRDIENGRVRQPQSGTVRRLVTALGLTDAEAASLRSAVRGEAERAGGELRLLVLGTLAVRRGGSEVLVARPMLRRTIGLLVLRHPQPVTRQELVDALWPAGPPSSYRSLVHTYVSQVRRSLAPDGSRPGGPGVERVPGGYVLRADRNQTDLGRFQELVARAERLRGAGSRESAFDSLTAALQCWRGPLFADLDPGLQQHPAAVAVAESRTEAALHHADLALELGRPEQSVRLLWPVAGGDPLHEGVHARLVLTLASCGEQAAALKVFTAFRDRLDDQLGISPGDEIRDAHLRVLRRQLPRPAHPGDPEHEEAPQHADAPRPTGAPVPPAQLPYGTSWYTGRERQLRELDALLDDDPAGHTPIVTVIGPPGAGKTALVLHWAHAHRDRFPGGQLFVNLQGHSPLPALRPVDVLARFLRSLGVAPGQVPPDEDEAAALLRTLLTGRRLLIVLDDAAGAGQVRPLLPGDGDCRTVVTSRTHLSGLVANDGARPLGLDVLRPDEARILLTRVLGERRVAAEPDAVTELAGLCGRLPLALRIAGAALLARRTLGIAEYCAELADGGPLGGLRLEDDERSAVRAAFRLSYEALSGPARRMFRLLGLAPGPDITAPGAAALTDAAPGEAGRLLRTLAHAHLVQQPGPGRFGMHDLLRSYARELVADDERGARRRLLDWYTRGAREASLVLYPQAPGERTAADTERATEWLESERENLIGAVLSAAEAGEHRTAWRLAEALHGFLSQGTYTTECLAVAEAGLAAATADGDLRARSAARLRIADCHWAQGHNAAAQDQYADALQLAASADWADGQAAALRRIGAAHQENGAMRTASGLFLRARGLSGQTEGAGAADDLMNLGLIGWKLGRLPEAVAHYTQAARIFRDLGALGGEAVAHTNLGVVHRAMGRPLNAIRVVEESLRVHRISGNKASGTVALSCLASAHADRGDHASATRLARSALDSARSVRNRRLESNAYFSLGVARERAGDLAGASAGYRSALDLAEVVDDRYPQVSALVGLAAVRLRLGAFEDAHATAHRALALAQEAGFRVLEASALNVLAQARVVLGEPERALDDARRALALHQETGHRPGEARSHLVLGDACRVLGDRGGSFGHWRRALLIFDGMGLAGFRDLRAR